MINPWIGWVGIVMEVKQIGFDKVPQDVKDDVAEILDIWNSEVVSCTKCSLNIDIDITPLRLHMKLESVCHYVI